MNEHGKRVLADDTNRLSSTDCASQPGKGVYEAASNTSAYSMPVIDVEDLMDDDTTPISHSTHNIQSYGSKSTITFEKIQGLDAQMTSDSTLMHGTVGVADSQNICLTPAARYNIRSSELQPQKLVAESAGINEQAIDTTIEHHSGWYNLRIGDQCPQTSTTKAAGDQKELKNLAAHSTGHNPKSTTAKATGVRKELNNTKAASSAGHLLAAARAAGLRNESSNTNGQHNTRQAVKGAPVSRTTPGTWIAAPGVRDAPQNQPPTPVTINNTTNTQQPTAVHIYISPIATTQIPEEISRYVMSYTHVRKNTQDSGVEDAKYVPEPQCTMQAHAYAQAQMHTNGVNSYTRTHAQARMYRNTINPKEPSPTSNSLTEQQIRDRKYNAACAANNSMIPVTKQEYNSPALDARGSPLSLSFPCLYLGKGLTDGCPFGDACQFSHSGDIPVWVRPFYEREVLKLRAASTTHTGYNANDVYAGVFHALAPPDKDILPRRDGFAPSPASLGPAPPITYNKWIPAPRASEQKNTKKVKLDPMTIVLAQKSALMAPDDIQMVQTVVIPPHETDVFSLPRLQRKDFDNWYQERIRNDPSLTLDEDQLRCVRLTIVDEKNVFLTGSAGVGKSHTTATVRDFLKRLYEREDYPDRVVVAAPTGVAATHIDGTTINSATGVGIPSEVADFQRMMKPAMYKLWTQDVELFMVDEISMVSGEFLDCLDSQIRLMCMNLPKNMGKKLHELPPFGGIQIFFCGDFLQLPPIEGSIPFETMKKLDPQQLKRGLAIEKYKNEKQEWTERSYFLNRGFAFSASTWGRLDLVTITLSKCYRQLGQQLFVHHLNQIRNGRADQRTLDYFNQFRTPLPDHRLPTTLFPFNKKVQQLNSTKLASLCSQAMTFHAHDHVNGLNNCHDETALWESELFKGGSLAERALQLKTNARVLLIRNLDLKGTDKLKPLINGSSGVVTNWTSKVEAEQTVQHRMNYLSTRVEALHSALGHGEYSRGSRACEISDERACEVEHELLQIVAAKYKWKLPVVEFNNGRQMIILPCLFRNEVMGQGMTYRLQIPLKLGWAVSIHKSQGMTLTAGNVSTAGAFAEGQSYVALSRVTGPEALYMIDMLTMKDIKMPRQPVIYNQIMAQLDMLSRKLCVLTGEKKWLTMGPRELVDKVKLYDTIPRDIKLTIVNLVKRLTPWARTNLENEVKHWNTISPKQSRNYPSTGSNIQCYKCRQMGHYSSKCPSAGFSVSRYR
ncbi:hypothetical protein SARC_05992 [Sphaeroforma arctica JP610]|uniref:ATP-dependent DNA helicase n=1 Tax=Sphaeroforma arctica JP610 TaxID=667725 RepID=A0A0L0FY05_9EUKA|nr:hypothetical protein SARC_05992 [Sphaeroforma arctica JP610]KNC81702.1 hypothetical protein SARC_05992 [Sphaeroforma arctica JP610]|eukprot:XP_014155604.1 hypothetical protein SARC_05992 [Sphaeroforma arctica JP610]